MRKKKHGGTRTKQTPKKSTGGPAPGKAFSWSHRQPSHVPKKHWRPGTGIDFNLGN